MIDPRAVSITKSLETVWQRIVGQRPLQRLRQVPAPTSGQPMPIFGILIFIQVRMVTLLECLGTRRRDWRSILVKRACGRNKEGARRGEDFASISVNELLQFSWVSHLGFNT
jgi:hypothetical protein